MRHIKSFCMIEYDSNTIWYYGYVFTNFLSWLSVTIFAYM